MKDLETIEDVLDAIDEAFAELRATEHFAVADIREGERADRCEIVGENGRTFEVVVRDVTGVAPTEGREG